MIDLPEQAPAALLADKGYDADAIRADLAKRKIEAVIPGRSNRRVNIEHDRALYKQRNRIERMFTSRSTVPSRMRVLADGGGTVRHAGAINLTAEIALITTGRGLIRRDIRIEGVKILGAADAAQRKSTGGDQMTAPGCIEAGAKGR